METIPVLPEDIRAALVGNFRDEYTTVENIQRTKDLVHALQSLDCPCAEEYRLGLLRDRTAHGVGAMRRAAEAVIELATNAKIEAITAQGILDTQFFPLFQKGVDRGQ